MSPFQKNSIFFEKHAGINLLSTEEGYLPDVDFFLEFDFLVLVWLSHMSSDFIKLAATASTKFFDMNRRNWVQGIEFELMAAVKIFCPQFLPKYLPKGLILNYFIGEMQ